MNAMQLSFIRQWTIYHPIVTRYLKSEHVDAFFKDGTLRLSPFRLFRENPDEQQGDDREGRIAAELRGPNSRHVVQAVNGQASFVLCGGLVENKGMEASFSTEAAFRILDTVRFADFVSRHIPGFVAGMQGNCIYRDDTILRKKFAHHFEPPVAERDAETWSARQDQLISEQTREGFFIKHLKYAHQNEYRLIWFALGDESKEPLFVKCPDARNLCERV
jgi:hypothetical protein